VIAALSKLLVTALQRLWEWFAIDVRTRCVAESIDRGAGTVRVRTLDDGREQDLAYDHLIFAPGAAPRLPPLPGGDHPAVLTLRNLADVDRVKGAVDAALGRGAASSARVHRPRARREPRPPRRGDDRRRAPGSGPAAARPGDDHAAGGHAPRPWRGAPSRDVGDGFRAGRTGRRPTRLASAAELGSDLVTLGVGVRPESALAVAAGLDVGPRGGIRVDERMCTSDPRIYAVGDAIAVGDFVGGGPTQVPLAGPANRQGRIAATAILRPETLPPIRYRGTQGTAIVGVFDKVAACTGAAEKTLRRAGRAFRKIYVHPAHHAGYYPGAEQLSLKVLFDPATGKLLGAQAVGGVGVDKRIDVIAIALQAGMTVFDLEEAKLCYAPQFGSAKDPVNKAGFVAGGMLRGEHSQADVETCLDGPPDAGTTLLDVRTAEENAAGHLPGALSIPLDELRARLGELPRGGRILAYHQVCQRGYLASRIFLQAGSMPPISAAATRPTGSTAPADRRPPGPLRRTPPGAYDRLDGPRPAPLLHQRPPLHLGRRRAGDARHVRGAGPRGMRLRDRRRALASGNGAGRVAGAPGGRGRAGRGAFRPRPGLPHAQRLPVRRLPRRPRQGSGLPPRLVRGGAA
jgi:NADPH-dependent 2,4-dienoyl-CoA reductase/sulfur reductase-like enzyme